MRKETSEETFALQMAVLRSEIMQPKAKGKIIIFTDECMFSTATMLKLAYSGFRTNLSIDERLRNSETIAMLGGVSAENGLEAFIMKPKSINS